MTNHPSEYESAGSAGATDAAKDEAGAVKDTAVSAGQNVAATAKDEAQKVAGETRQQAKSLIASVSDEVSSQVGTQQLRIAISVDSLAQELSGMAASSPESGPLTDLAQQAGRRGSEIATWLGDHEPSDVLQEVKSFARRRPGSFLVLCGLAGVVVGRLTRGAVAANTELDSAKPSRNAQAAELPRREIVSEYPASPAPPVEYPPASLVEEPALGESPAALDPAYPAGPAGTWSGGTDRPGGVQ